MNKYIYITISFLMILFFSGCGAHSYNQLPKQAAILTNSNLANERIMASGNWRSSGVQVEKGKQYLISATGKWRVGGWPHGWSGADGLGSSSYLFQEVKGYSGAALIARIGNNAPFFVGESLEFTAKNDGILYFRINEGSLLADNQGYMDVTIKKVLGKVETKSAQMGYSSATGSRKNFEPIGSQNSFERWSTPQPTPGTAIDFGDYYALIIGNNHYREMPNLKTPQNDATAVEHILKNNYGFRVEKITNGTRYDILSALDRLRGELSQHDNLLVYYAGHGYFDRDAERGYWLPIDASRDTSANWISNADISDKLKVLRAKNVIIVADSCFSGTLTRGVNISMKSSNYWQEVAAMRSRTVLTSGGVEPVSDAGAGNHSVFAKAFIETLQSNQNIMDGTELFTRIRRPVFLNANQTPEYGDIRLAGHEGGDFLFIRKSK